MNKYIWIHMDRYNLIDSTHKLIKSKLDIDQAFKKMVIQEFDEEEWEYLQENNSIEKRDNKIIVDAEEWGLVFIKL